MADRAVREIVGLLLKLTGLRRQLLQRFRQPVGHLNVVALQLADRFGLVAAGDALRRSIFHHDHHQLQHVDDAGAAMRWAVA